MIFQFYKLYLINTEVNLLNDDEDIPEIKNPVALYNECKRLKELVKVARIQLRQQYIEQNTLFTLLKQFDETNIIPVLGLGPLTSKQVSCSGQIKVYDILLWICICTKLNENDELDKYLNISNKQLTKILSTLS